MNDWGGDVKWWKYERKAESIGIPDFVVNGLKIMHMNLTVKSGYVHLLL